MTTIFDTNIHFFRDLFRFKSVLSNATVKRLNVGCSICYNTYRHTCSIKLKNKDTLSVFVLYKRRIHHNIRTIFRANITSLLFDMSPHICYFPFFFFSFREGREFHLLLLIIRPISFIPTV